MRKGALDCWDWGNSLWQWRDSNVNTEENIWDAGCVRHCCSLLSFQPYLHPSGRECPGTSWRLQNHQWWDRCVCHLWWLRLNLIFISFILARFYWIKQTQPSFWPLTEIAGLCAQTHPLLSPLRGHSMGWMNLSKDTQQFGQTISPYGVITPSVYRLLLLVNE